MLMIMMMSNAIIIFAVKQEYSNVQQSYNSNNNKNVKKITKINLATSDDDHKKKRYLNIL